MMIRGHRLYPSAFARLAAEDVARVCKALNGLDAVAIVVFWLRNHGALEGTSCWAGHGRGDRLAKCPASGQGLRRGVKRHREF